MFTQLPGRRKSAACTREQSRAIAVHTTDRPIGSNRQKGGTWARASALNYRRLRAGSSSSKALTSCPAGRRRRACGRIQCCHRRAPRPIDGSRRSVAGLWRLSYGAYEAITDRSSCRTTPTKRCGLKPWRRPGRRESIRGARSPISRRRRRQSKARTDSRWCSRWPMRTMCRRRSGRSSRPASAFDRSSRRPTRSSGWRDRDRPSPSPAGLRPTSPWTEP